jgi:hypothetical protein
MVMFLYVVFIADVLTTQLYIRFVFTDKEKVTEEWRKLRSEKLHNVYALFVK